MKPFPAAHPAMPGWVDEIEVIGWFADAASIDPRHALQLFVAYTARQADDGRPMPRDVVDGVWLVDAARAESAAHAMVAAVEAIGADTLARR